MKQDVLDALTHIPGRRRRALFYVYDGGSGIGHLRRLARIANALKENFSCLIVTGHDAAAQWFVPDGCEYVRLPAWDNLIPAKAAYWGRTPFIDVPISEAVRLRSAILAGIVEGFQPDAIFVDHLPLGAHAELASVLRSTHCRKYLVTRGVQNETEDLQSLVLGGAALEALRAQYDRILSAIDPRVFDLTGHYNLPPDVLRKVTSVGYAAPRADPDLRQATRSARGLSDGAIWVVASAGGGQWGEPLIEACLASARHHPDVHFDLIMGPRSRMTASAVGTDRCVAGHIQLHGSCPQLASLHSAADLVVTTGGYNSLLEAIRGRARILCIPYRKSHRDEPFHHATLLQPYVSVQVATEPGDLAALLNQTIKDCKVGPVTDRRNELSMDGADRIAEIVMADLGAGAAP